MKTMLLLQKLSKYFLILLSLVSFSVLADETKWEVAIVFRGEGEDAQFQRDIDDNILELARLNPKSSVKIGIYRELNGKSYTYLPNGSGKKEINLSDILDRQDLKQIKISGTLKNHNSRDMDSFLKTFYKDQSSKKALIIYSHGKGADGLKGLSTADLTQSLALAPHLDLLWLDACFMANFEFLYELRQFSDYTISSEEAEFASGLPFQDLSLLSSSPTGKSAAVVLAKIYIESYSYLKNGRQRNYVVNTSATISVVENKKLEAIATSLKWVSSIVKKLKPELLDKLKKTLLRNASMDNRTLVDLGIFLIELRKLINHPETDKKLTVLIRQLNIEAVKKLKTNPRLHLEAPAPGSLMVYGFNNWIDGSEIDFNDNNALSTLVGITGFTDGPNQKKWPYKKIAGDKLIASPFAPGISVFNYYFLDAQGKLLSSAMSAARTHDVVESSADSESTPLVYSAYTQQLGVKAERYTGLNISMPGTTPSLDYFEMEFNRLADWLSL